MHALSFYNFLELRNSVTLSCSQTRTRLGRPTRGQEQLTDRVPATNNSMVRACCPAASKLEVNISHGPARKPVGMRSTPPKPQMSSRSRKTSDLHDHGP